LFPAPAEDLCGKEIVQIAAGENRVLGLTRNGQLYVWGNGALKPRRIFGKLDGLVVSDVASSAHFGVAVTQSGEVFAVKQGVFFKSPQTRRISLPSSVLKVKAVACGPHASLLLSGDGRVFQVDNGHCRASLVEELEDRPVSKIACGADVNLALTREGHLYCWSYKPDFFLSQTFPYRSRPTPVSPGHQVFVDVAASFWSGFCAVGTLEGKILVFGQCLGRALRVPEEVTVESLREAAAYYSKPPVTHEPLTFGNDPTPVGSVGQSWRLAFDDQASSDLRFVLDGQVVNVHKAFLVNRSEYFRNLFLEDGQEIGKLEVAVPHISVPKPLSFLAFRSYLSYLYTDTFEATFSEASELLRAASFFGDTHLFKRCQYVLQAGLQVDNAAALFKTALDYGARDLEDQTFQFCFRHLKAVSQTESFKSWDDGTSKRFIERIVTERV